ncbi:MAG: NUDIX domain-containing protein [Planctomycetota bacterium]|nr:MAG: NUDIX domain-containing protein [Planctomycetota bacterium]
MRTLPRKEAVARRSARLASQADGSDEIPAPADDASEFSDPRTGDRRQRERRRRSEPRPPGEERRRGRSRRLRRRRRSARWGPEGRLELPKGKLEPGESAEEAAVREVREELGFDGALAVRGLLSKNHYSFRTPDGRLIFKTVHYFLLACEEEDPSFAPRAEEGVVGVEWWSGERAIQQVAFPNLKPVLEKAWGLLQG